MNIDKDIEIVKELITHKDDYVVCFGHRIAKPYPVGIEKIQAIENLLSEFEQLINTSIDTVFEKNNFETEALAHTLHKLGIIDKRGNLYVYHKKLEREEKKNARRRNV